MTIKPHSSLQNHFVGDEIKINLDSYNDLLDYLTVMQPAFIFYSKQLISEGLQESFAFLDENLNEIQKDDFFIKRFKTDTTVHIVPVVMGGGGKRGGILAILAAAALFFIAPYIAPTLAGVIPGATAETVKLAIIQSAIGLAISGLSAVLMKAPSAPKNADSARVENNMFSSLRNTIDSGTFVPINYGMPRVAGHLVSGYIKTINHAKGARIAVSDVIGFDTSLYDPNLAAQSNFLTVPNSTTVIVSDGLLMYIDPGNENSYSGASSVTDLISGQTGTISGTVTLDNFAFKLGGGYIDMGKSYISADEINDTDKQYTIEFWIKRPRGLFNGNAINNSALGVAINFATVNVVTYKRKKDGGIISKNVFYAQNNPINVTGATTVNMSVDGWVHVAYTLNGTTLKSYLNTGLRITDTVSSTISGATNLLIGSAGLSGSYIGCVRLYNRELSASEIARNFNAEKARFEISSIGAFIVPAKKVTNTYDRGGR